jgi:hypothetical protein
MDTEDYRKLDLILKATYPKKDFLGIHWRDLIKETGLSETEVDRYREYLEDTGLSENNWKVEEDTDDIYLKLTAKGRMFFNEGGFMKQHSRAENPTTINVHIGGNNNGNLILSSTVNDVINKLTSENRLESAGHLEIIKDLIQDSKNEEAIIAFEEFNKELIKPEKNNTLIKILWKTIETAIPHVPKLIEVGHKLLQDLHVI